jgi:hypothetical protein
MPPMNPAEAGFHTLNPAKAGFHIHLPARQIRLKPDSTLKPECYQPEAVTGNA